MATHVAQYDVMLLSIQNIYMLRGEQSPKNMLLELLRVINLSLVDLFKASFSNKRDSSFPSLQLGARLLDA